MLDNTQRAEAVKTRVPIKKISLHPRGNHPIGNRLPNARQHTACYGVKTKGAIKKYSEIGNRHLTGNRLPNARQYAPR